MVVVVVEEFVVFVVGGLLNIGAKGKLTVTGIPGELVVVLVVATVGLLNSGVGGLLKLRANLTPRPKPPPPPPPTNGNAALNGGMEVSK